MKRRWHTSSSYATFPSIVKPKFLYVKDIKAGEFRADFLVNGQVVVDIKAIQSLTGIEEAQLLNYLKGTGYCVGLLFNFKAISLEYKRRVV